MDSAALKFWIVVRTFSVATSMRLCSEPMTPRAVLTLLMATSIWLIADCALASVSGSVETVSADARRSSAEPETEIWSLPLYWPDDETRKVPVLAPTEMLPASVAAPTAWFVSIVTPSEVKFSVCFVAEVTPSVCEVEPFVRVTTLLPDDNVSAPVPAQSGGCRRHQCRRRERSTRSRSWHRRRR